ncbi:MAG: response regulator [Hyphomicrobiales bacterium]|nr:response regulator [Hyphomicrobiales bacterium]
MINGGTVLIVDDDEINRDLISRQLTRRGIRAEAVGDAATALEKIKEGGYDAVLLDVMMPGVDGFETLACIRETHGKRELPVIMVTAKSESDALVQALEAGANDFISKPIDYPILLARLGNQIALKHAESELRALNGLLEERVRERTVALMKVNERLKEEVAERKKAAEWAARQHQYLDAVMAASADGMVTISADGRIKSVNASAERIFGYRGDELVGQDGSILLPGNLVRGLKKWSAMTAGERARNGFGAKGVRELRGRHKDGTEFPIDVSFGEVETQGEHLFIYGIRDVSQRKDMEAKLHQAQKLEAVGRLTGGVAHDFNNLLTVVIGNLQLMERSMNGDEKTLARLNKVMVAAKSGADLTRRMLSFSRQQVLDTRAVDINDLVRDTEKLLARTLGEDIHLSTALSRQPCVGRTDPNQLAHALLNLCINARDAMPRGGRLKIETRPTVLDQDYADTHNEVTAGEYVEIAVSDTGTGIPPQMLDKIFEPFFTTKESGKGTGLGLSTVFGFMKQSGGHVSVYSEVGHGTTFKLFVPLGDPAELEDEEDAVSGAVAARRRTILVVEDDERVREIAVTFLEDVGYEVIQASDAAAGLAAFQSHPEIDAVFSDIIMPGGMTGPEMVERMLMQRPGTPVLFASGYAEHALRDRQDLMRNAQFIAKPYNVSELPQRIDQLLEVRE